MRQTIESCDDHTICSFEDRGRMRYVSPHSTHEDGRIGAAIRPGFSASWLVRAGKLCGLLRALRRRTVCQRMQFLARLEAHRLARRYAHLGAGAGIAANPGLTCPNAEHAESA